jgi:ribosomal protein S12 methylthiotransferase accessory factor YcaO
MKADQELAKIMERLEPEGALYLFYQPPATGKIRSIVDSTSQNLLHAGFTIQFIDIGHQQPIPVVCVIGSK